MHIRCIIVALTALIISGCGFYGWSASGRVVLSNIETIETINKTYNLRPAQDAYIKVEWYGIVPRPADAAGYCCKVKIVKTDSAGDFSSGSVWMMPKPYPVFGMSAAVTVYKPGYQEHLEHRFPESFHVLAKAEETSKERLFRLYLYSDVKACSEIVRNENLENYLAAILEEARSLQIANIEEDSLYQSIKKTKDEFSQRQ